MFIFPPLDFISEMKENNCPLDRGGLWIKTRCDNILCCDMLNYVGEGLIDIEEELKRLICKRCKRKMYVEFCAFKNSKFKWQGVNEDGVSKGEIVPFRCETLITISCRASKSYKWKALIIDVEVVKTFQIHVKFVTGKIVSPIVCGEMTIDQLITNINNRMGYDYVQRLTFNGRYLDSWRTIDRYPIFTDSTLHAIPILRGD